jgi:cytochrome bd-type quinol oxidase subunit 2
MIYFKIYFTLIFVTLIVAVAGVTWSLMNSDNKRSDLWFKISKISWITTLVMIIVGALTAIWFFD